MDATLINSKGCGGNNATAAILAPHIVRKMLAKKHGAKAMKAHQETNGEVQERTDSYDESMLRGENSTIYNFGVGVVDGEKLQISSTDISIPGQKNAVSLEMPNPYEDFL